MAIYICKCGRQVNKSINADNTGNRDTDGCTGCPYLLPWGPDKYIEGQGFTKDVQGYECRMSPTISYTTTYRGQANDKCTLHILSLDLDFMDEVQAWIYDNAADTLSAGFSRGSMRGTDFSNKGRYSLSISCAQNKKGMAAKAALIEQFFTGGRVRKDMTLAQEKAHILDAIRKGKEQAQRKDQSMKRQNDRCPLQQECERTCQVIGHERDCDYYVNNRYSTGGIPDQDEILTEEELRQEREREEKYLADLSLAPAEPAVYQNDYGTLFAVREHNGAPALMCKPMAADAWTLSGVLAAVQGEAYTAEDLQEVLDDYARAHGWKKEKSESATAPAGAGTQNLSAAEPAALAAKDTNVPTFDYSGLDGVTVDTLHLAENIIRSARQKYIIDLAGAVDMAHEELVRNSDGHNQHTEETFVAWCRSVGISKTTAYQLLQVQALLSGSTPEEQATLEAASPSLLYAAAKPSAPAELVQAVKDGDITSHKQYQEALAEIRARDAKINDLLEMSEAADRRADKAEQAAKDTARERDTALRRATEAENRAAGAQKLADQRGDENASLKAQIRDLESRPVEVAVAQPGEDQIEAWRKEGEDRAAAALQDRLRKADQAKADVQRQVAALQDQLAAARPDADACQRTADTLYETAENLRILLRTQLRQAQLTPADYGNVVAHVLLVANALRDTVRNCAPAGYTMDDDEEDFL